MRTNTVPVDIFCSGTLRDEDVLPAIADLLRPLRLTREHRALVREVDRIDWEQEDDGISDLSDELWGALDDYLPPYTYAGSSEGDGALFGVWAEVDCDIPKYPAGESPNGSGDCYEVTDHGNVSCGYRRKNGTWVEYWSVV